MFAFIYLNVSFAPMLTRPLVTAMLAVDAVRYMLLNIFPQFSGMVLQAGTGEAVLYVLNTMKSASEAKNIAESLMLKNLLMMST